MRLFARWTGFVVLCCGLVASNATTDEGFPMPAFSAWTQAGNASFFVQVSDDEAVARITNAPENAAAYPRMYTAVPVEPGTMLEATARARALGITGGYGAYMTLEHVDGEGQRISFDQSGPAMVQEGWTPLKVRGVVPRGAAETRLCLVVNGAGTGWFRGPALRVLEGPPPAANTDSVTLRVANTPLDGPFLGFGFEDDGWFYNAQNAAHGADEAAYALREERIRALSPDWVRMFFWYQDWNPAHDWETFTFDSENMESKYRTLALYQDLGAPVMGCGVEWGMRAPFANPEALARATGALLEHLIRVKGFDVIRYWTLTNEPNLGFERKGATFDDYVRIHQLLRAEFDARNLDVQLVGSDDTNGGDPWFAACVASEDYFNRVGLFASHIYLKHDGRRLANPFFQERLDALAGRKPFVVAEFGFQDERAGTFENPLMRTYDYALWSLSFAIEGLNRGVAGFAIWSLAEVYYPGRNDIPMEYALWNFGPDWELRPIYAAWKLLGAHTARGDAVRPVASGHPEVRAVMVNGTLFWVNESERPLHVSVEGGEFDAAEVHTEAGWQKAQTLPLDNTSAEIDFPARSFGCLVAAGNTATP